MHKTIRLLGLFNFFTDFNLYGAVLVIYFTKVSGSFVLAMSLFSVVMVSSALLEIPTGVFSDKIGRRKTIILGALSSIISISFYAIGRNYWILFIGAVIQGLQRAWYSGNNDAYLHDLLSNAGRKDEYDTFLGKTSSMFQIAAAVGVGLGAVIANWSFSLVMWLSVIPQILCLFISLNLMDVPNLSQTSGNIYTHVFQSIKDIWNKKTLRLLTINNVIKYGIGESAYQFTGAFVNTLWPLWAVGIGRVLSSVWAAISFWFSGKINKKFGDFKILLIGNIYGKTVDIISVAFPSVLSPLLMSTSSLTFGTSTVAISKLMQKEYSEDKRATTDSAVSLLSSMFFGFCAIVLGFFADRFGPSKAMLIAFIVSLPTIGIYWHLYRANQIASFNS